MKMVKTNASYMYLHLMQLISSLFSDEQYVSNRSLALLRFTKNHDNLAEIFSPVSIGGPDESLVV